MDHIQTPLTESGLTFTQVPTGDGGLTTMLMHAESGEYIIGEYFMKPVKNDPQSLGSAITYQRRYSLCAVLGLNIEEDDDGNGASGKDGKRSQRKTAKRVNCHGLMRALKSGRVQWRR
ncbi:ERF family protein [Paraflavitalea speifideaquila]|uniref:ERF family protein n=1 Tax=Paraflavitalea speifideaquila TaxID=3076558 RepID=UPI003312FB30